MSYRVTHADPTSQAAVRRIARAEIEAALRAIDDRGPDTAAVIHAVRKRCKKIRGLLRLVRPVFDGYRAENAAFRDIAAQLGPLRDAEVLVDAFDDAVGASGGDDAATFAPVRDRLRLHRVAIAQANDPEAQLRAAREGLATALPRIDGWKLTRHGFEAFAAGLQSSYRRGRKAMRAACRHGDDTAFHDWRKRCKDHTFHLRLLRPIWPGPMRAQCACAAELGEVLGLHHDLAVLAERAGDMDGIGRSAGDALVARVRSRQRELEQRAHALGARLYAEPPSALATSWRRRYAAWRRGQES